MSGRPLLAAYIVPIPGLVMPTAGGQEGYVLSLRFDEFWNVVDPDLGPSDLDGAGWHLLISTSMHILYE